jgi:sugar (pentulose or hexulose) kinase
MIGLDIGTTSCAAVVFAAGGRPVVASGTP